MVWDDHTVELLKQHWRLGLSISEIARQLGVSKNAIVGKAHRLDLDARPSPIRRENGSPAPIPSTPRGGMRVSLPPLPSLPTPEQADGIASMAEKGYRPPVIARSMGLRQEVVKLVVKERAKAPPPPPPPAPVAQVSKPRTPTLYGRVVECCWPIGEPGTRTFRMCDDASAPGKPYCEEHCNIAYVRGQDRKEQAA